MKQLLDELYCIVKWCDTHYMIFIFVVMFGLLLGISAWLVIWEHTILTKTY